MFTSILRNLFIMSTLLLTANGTQLVANQSKAPDEEAFLIRRIAEFWKDGDFKIVKMQVVEFLEQYPASDMKDYFLGILGDIYLHENNYEYALSSYQKITDPSVAEKTILNKLQCYYELDQYEELSTEGRPLFSNMSSTIQGRKDELYFLMGESLFRQALKEESLKDTQELALEAKNYYNGLDSNHYKEASQFALAEISGILGEYELAAESYKSLAEKHPDMKEELLFQVASLEAEYNKTEAVKTFSIVQEMNGKYKHDAAFNRAVMLFQNNAYEEILSCYEKVAEDISEERQPAFNYILGKSFFSSEQYEEALGPIQNYIDSTSLPTDQLKNALLIQMSCSHQTNNEALFSDSFEKLSSLFPNDPEIPKALFIHAMILKEQGDISLASEKLKMIANDYNEFEDQENFLFEWGLLSYQNGQWKESYEAFKSYADQFPSTPRVDSAWKLFFSSALSRYKAPSEEEANAYTKSDFYLDLQALLSHKEYLNTEELKEYALLYSKTAYELEDYNESLRSLQDYIFSQDSENYDSLTLAEAHFLAGLVFAELKGDNSAFCMHLEQAITLNPEFYDSANTHVQLYNAYISLAGFGDLSPLPSDGKQQQEFIDNAAEHLQAALDKGELAIKEENSLWLANYYYNKVSECFDDAHGVDTKIHPEIVSTIDLAASIYHKVLYTDNHLIDLTAQNLHLEHEVIKFTKLLEFQGEHTQKLEILKTLLEQQSEKLSLNWTSQKEALFELGTAYSALGHKEKAYETYTFINASPNNFPTLIANNARLEAARLHFELLGEDLKNESNEEILSILNDLKELQIRKNAFSEPAHLEAALEYAKIRSELSKTEEQDTRYLFFLGRIKEDFTSTEDLVTQDYLESINNNEEKKQLFNAYMKFVDAEKIRLEAKHMYQLEQLGEMEELHEQALSLYNDIKNSPSSPRDLYIRIDESIAQINALNAY